MRLKIETAKGEKEFRNHKRVVVIGNTPACDINLSRFKDSGPSIKISEKKDGLYVTNLSELDDIIINGELLTPGVEFEFNSFFPMFVGPYTISAIDEDLDIEVPVQDVALETIAQNLGNESSSLPPSIPAMPKEARARTSKVVPIRREKISQSVHSQNRKVRRKKIKRKKQPSQKSLFNFIVLVLILLLGFSIYKFKAITF